MKLEDNVGSIGNEPQKDVLDFRFFPFFLRYSIYNENFDQKHYFKV